MILDQNAPVAVDFRRVLACKGDARIADFSEQAIREAEKGHARIVRRYIRKHIIYFGHHGNGLVRPSVQISQSRAWMASSKNMPRLASR